MRLTHTLRLAEDEVESDREGDTTQLQVTHIGEFHVNDVIEVRPAIIAALLETSAYLLAYIAGWNSSRSQAQTKWFASPRNKVQVGFKVADGLAEQRRLAAKTETGAMSTLNGENLVLRRGFG